MSSEVVLGGRKVAVRRPRVRTDGREVPLPTFQAMDDVDPLNRRVVEQMLVGVATRRYARSLEPVPATTRSRFRRLNGYTDMPTLVAALRARDRQLGLVTVSEERQIA